MKYYSNLPLIKVINMVDEKGYDVIPVKIKDKFKVYVFFNNEFLREGTILFDDYDVCLSESYRKLYKLIK